MRHPEVLIVGGGNAGISLAARLLRDGATDVAVVAPQPVHRYKPLLNYVGGGQATMADLERPMADVVPDGCEWIRDSVVAVDPDGMTDVAIVAPQPVHRYKPLLNYVGGGQATMADLERPMADVVPDGCSWIRDSVAAVDPSASTVHTRAGRTLHYSTLV
ncbi:MAG TPA: hypothetical protein VFG13_02965, partial [Blastococcus sp.]|nr:hypothetical protein [Blastococcus sp.]